VALDSFPTRRSSDLEGRTALRGGVGRYYDQTFSNTQVQSLISSNGDTNFTVNLLNDRSPTFMSNPLLKYSPACDATVLHHRPARDRKSTRLNSSHEW